MLALLQRTKYAQVSVNKKIIGQIKQGILVFIGIEKPDVIKNADRLIERILGYRIFSDAKERMNLSVQDINGGVLLVPQFTLAADTKKGMRPSFTPAADPDKGRQLFDYLVTKSKQIYPHIEQGEFGAHMQIELCNDGPVTFLLKT